MVLGEVEDVQIKFLLLGRYLSICIPWPFPPVWGVANNTQETTKQWGFNSVLLAMTRGPAEFGWHCWSNTAHPPPSSTTYVASYMPSPLLPLPPGCLYKATPWQQQICEKYLGKGKDVYFAFLDLEKAYERVDRDAVWNVLR